jgi:hypothetical protein
MSNEKVNYICVCAWCKKVKDNHGNWRAGDESTSTESTPRISHGMCPECEKEIRKEMDTLT